MPKPSIRLPRSRAARRADPRGADESARCASDASEETTSTDAALAGYRLLRRLAAGDRADIYLAVADVASGRSPFAPEDAEAVTSSAPLVVMRVYGPGSDDEAITTEIEAMEADATGTLPRLLDVANVRDGRGCLVVERVAGRPLSELLADGLVPGQAVTALAPVVVALRGLADRGFVHTRLARFDLVIDDSGRPRLLGLGALRRTDRFATAADRVAVVREGHAAMLRLIDDVAARCSDPSAFSGPTELLRAALEARPFERVEAQLERALFAVAPAEPIVASVLRRPPEVPALRSRALGIADAPAEPASPADESAERDPGAPARRGRLAALLQLSPDAVDGLATALDADPRAQAVRRMSDWTRQRRPALLAGGLVGAAALVALLTAVPPASSTESAADSGTTTATAGADAPESGDLDDRLGLPEPDAGAIPARASLADLPEDPVAAAAALLEIRQTCLAARDVECVLAVDQPGSPIAVRDRGEIDADGPAPDEVDLDAITVAADLGDAVVLTVPWSEVEREPASLLMMRSEAGWRLREWFD
ncbi:hypothetical protein [Agromyces indicus]|uniref:Protein kinase domain-containing protein n=1 Tax=Agromyces indicus TaxID=758919 RepID=A0ABU1FP71_9MICO|nr:hypothetical protein [Agromyces indicus]MDR5693558.1 hypothetical protein [Agromyces indicus]